jgi:hypothetical protein
MSMTRWRLRTWFADRPTRPKVTQYQGACKLCAIARCIRQARAMDAVRRVRPGTCLWQVERLTGVVDRWEIVFTNRSRIGDWVLNHGH